MADEVRELRQLATRVAGSLLRDWVGDERAAEASGRIAAAFAACAASARNPSDLAMCTPQSVATCVALAALTGIMPGTGPTALAYLIPRRARRGEAPHLRYEFSHRGLCALALRCGVAIFATPVRHEEHLVVDGGEVIEHRGDPDHPPESWETLRGVIVTVRRVTGVTLFRGWVPRSVIERRRALSETWRQAESGEAWRRDSSPWHQWPVEQAMKTAIHYAIARGWCVIDDSAVARALSIDALSDIAERPVTVAARLDSLADRLGAAQQQVVGADAATSTEVQDGEPAAEDA